MIGIDISDQSVKIIRLSNTKTHHLISHGWQAVPSGLIEKGIITDVAGVQKVITEALQACAITASTKDAVVASIPETQSFLRVIEIPVMNEHEVGEAVQWEVAQHIPFGLDNVYIDWQPVTGGHPAAAGRQEVLVGAAEKKVIDPLLATLRALNLDVAALELESQAIVRALISRELREKRGLLLVDLGGSATNVIIHDHGAIRFTASLARGSTSMLTGLTKEEAQLISGPPHEVQLTDIQNIATKLAPAEDELVIEIQGIVEFYNGLDKDHEVQEILLTGGGANLPGLDRAFLKYFDNVHIHRGSPWVNILPAGSDTKPPLGLQETVHYSTALGLALRSVLL